ncbi:MAG TPA: hypothetical protein VHN79_05570, partial [Lacunisphaera sp.]|nr:hypothetical protein [Lacunisphaera sp.]
MLRRFFLLACPLALVAQDTPPLTGAPDAAPVSQPPAEQILMPPEPGRFKRLFQPFRTDRAALSPDGRYLAYSLREGDALAVAVVEIARPEQMTAHVKVVDDRAATSMLAELQREPTPARIDWLGWVTPSRVVVETNQVYTTKGTGRDAGWQSWPGTLLAFDADGGNARQIANAGDLVELMADNSAATPGGRDPFSTRREVTWKFLPSEPGAEAGAGALEGDAADPEAAPVGVSAGATPSPRSPRTFDFDPARPGAVTVVASGAIRPTGNRMLGFYSLDATTGKLTSLNDQLITATTTPRIDRQGRVRLTVANTPRFSFPFPYHYLGATGRDRANSLDSVTGLDGFSVSPDNYFGARSVPLGFDEDPNILYYASNLSRDTYGIYSFNLATGQKGNLAIENPGHDLIDAPGAGFPDLKTLVFDRFTRQLAGIRYESAFRTTIWLQ